MEDKNQKLPSTRIQWESTNYLNTSRNYWKINIFSKFYLS